MSRPSQGGIVGLRIVFVVIGLFFFLTGISMSLLALGTEVGRGPATSVGSGT
jgi:hypothetical protein